MRIALCDDHKIFADKLEILINKFDVKNGMKSQIIHFLKPSLLFEYMQTEAVDIIFMDLEFCDENEDGILWLKIIKKHFPRVVVIIMTAYEWRYKEGYEVRAFRFMTKPIEERELFEYLRMSMEELQISDGISIMRRGIEHNIAIRDICYISAQAGGSEVWTRNDMFPSEDSLLKWEKCLSGELFFRCHSKYLVNMYNIKCFENQSLTMLTGEKIPVSRRRWRAFQLAYMKFDTRN